jgi:hypothetical protein
MTSRMLTRQLELYFLCASDLNKTIGQNSFSFRSARLVDPTPRVSQDYMPIRYPSRRGELESSIVKIWTRVKAFFVGIICRLQSRE